MRRRESVGRLRSPTWSGPEGSSHNGLRRVGRLLSLLHMNISQDAPIVATSWITPFSDGDPDDLHIIRVGVPCTPWVSGSSGQFWELGEWAGPGSCEIYVFNEKDCTVYLVRTDANEISLYNECDMPFPVNWDECETGRTFRLTGTSLHKSVSSMMNHDQPTWVIATGEHWVEFIAPNVPVIEVVRQLPPQPLSV
jgi:hypothetical protein